MGTGSASGKAIDLRLEPPLRPARLAARRHDAAERQVRPRRTTGRRRRSTPSTACAGCADVRATRAAAAGACPSPHRRTATGTTSSATRSGTSASASPCARCPPACSWSARHALRDRGRRAWPRPSGDGTTQADRQPARAGRHATRCAPTRPNPTPARCAGAAGLPGRPRCAYTRSRCREPGETRSRLAAPSFAQRRAETAVALPLRGDPTGRAAGAGARSRASAYARMYELARELTAGAPTIVRRRQARRALAPEQLQLQRARADAARYPLTRLPVPATSVGYCQQFSGAMALMLRMAGIPARVAAGFAPGSLQPGHGRVPRARPRRPLLGRGLLQRDRLGAVRPDAGGARRRSRSRPTLRRPAPPRRGDQRLARGAAAPDRGARRRRLGGAGSAADGGVVGLAAAAAGCCSCVGGRDRPGGWSVARAGSARRSWPRRSWPSCAARSGGWAGSCPRGTTLLGLERRLGRLAGPAAAALRGRAARAPLRPARARTRRRLRERRALRRDLTARGGLRGRLLGLIAIPPGGPRPV